MCGVAGEVRFGAPVDEAALRRMSGRLRHRGPDDEGLWMSRDRQVGLAHRRLAIIDLSPGGHQPMVDPHTGAVIVFNGEIYNFRALRAECEAAGGVFRSQSDTEVILALYRLWGVECLRKLRGMFAFALWDPRRRELFLARDRIGKKPLNYALTPDGVVFGSELDALARHPAVSRDLDLEALDLYLQVQYVPHPWTIYRQVRKLPPAHFAVIGPQGVRVQRYWELDYRTTVRRSLGEALEELDEILTEAVRLRMISDVPLGALLSGGVDSSVVAAVMSRLSAQPVKTFSIGFEEEAFNETAYAEEAARICRTDHHTRILKGDVAAVLPSIVRHYGEPYADPSAVPSFHVCKIARESVTVVLNGDGGDEGNAGYGHYRLDAMDTALATAGRAIPAALACRLVGHVPAGRTLAARGVRRILRGLAPGYSSLAYATYWGAGDRARMLGDQVRSRVDEWRRDLFMAARRRSSTGLDVLQYIDNNAYLPGDLMTKMDIASMHVGLEARSPLLDHVLVEFFASLAPDLRVRNGQGKFLLKTYGERFFSREFLQRRKMGFAIPVADWLRGPLRETLLDVLHDAEAMQPLDVAAVSPTITRFLDGRLQYGDGTRMWALLMYGLWRRHALQPTP